MLAVVKSVVLFKMYTNDGIIIFSNILQATLVKLTGRYEFGAELQLLTKV